MPTQHETEIAMSAEDKIDSDRRRLLASAGKFAAVTPPTIALLLAAQGRNYAYAGSYYRRW